eukprot:jgi/Psemu1/9956/gm1.9956_g
MSGARTWSGVEALQQLSMRNLNDAQHATSCSLCFSPNNDDDEEQVIDSKIPLFDIPLVAEKELCEWAIKLERLNLFSWMKGNLIQTRSRVTKDIYATAVPEIEGDGFEPHLIDWCYKKLIGAEVAALHSLLRNVALVNEENMSFPHAEDPTLPVRSLELQGNIHIDELHYSQCWIKTWEKK